MKDEPLSEFDLIPELEGNYPNPMEELPPDLQMLSYEKIKFSCDNIKIELQSRIFTIEQISNIGLQLYRKLKEEK